MGGVLLHLAMYKSIRCYDFFLFLYFFVKDKYAFDTTN